MGVWRQALAGGGGGIGRPCLWSCLVRVYWGGNKDKQCVRTDSRRMSKHYIKLYILITILYAKRTIWISLFQGVNMLSFQIMNPKTEQRAYTFMERSHNYNGLYNCRVCMNTTQLFSSLSLLASTPKLCSARNNHNYFHKKMVLYGRQSIGCAPHVFTECFIWRR